MADAVHAFKVLARSKAASAVVIFTIGIGAGISGAAASLEDSLFLRPLPYPSPSQLVVIRLEGTQRNGHRIETDPSERDRVGWLSESTAVVSAAFRRDLPPRLFEGPTLDRLNTSAVSPGYFETLGIKPLLGRLFSERDADIGSPLAIMLSADYWRTHFNGQTTALGTAVRFDNQAAQIVGVLPSTFFPKIPVWTILRFNAGMDGVRGLGATLFARVRPGLSTQSAAAQLTSVISSRPWTPGAGLKPHVLLQSILATSTAAARPTAIALGIVAFIVLLLACANVTGLQFARLPSRTSELATRMALGAGRRRIATQLLAESLALSSLGGVIGILISRVLIQRLMEVLPLPLAEDATPSSDSLIALLAPLVIAFGFGLISGLLSLRFAIRELTLQNPLNDRGTAAASRNSRRFSWALVVIEAAAATALVISAGLLLKSLQRMDRVDLGFVPSTLTTVQITPVDVAPQQLPEFYRNVLQGLRSVPGVQVVGASDQVPLMGTSVKTSARATTQKEVSVSVRQVLPGFFDALGVKILGGRDIDESDQSDKHVTGAVVSATAAKLLFDAPSPLGMSLSVFDDQPDVVGVVNDVRAGGPAQSPSADIYLPYRRPGLSPLPNLDLTMVIRTAPGVIPNRDELAGAVRSAGQRVAVDSITDGSQLYDDITAVARHRTELLSMLGLLGLLLALTAVGTTTARLVSSRTAEIGVRIALGANPRHVPWMIARGVAVPATVGVGTGVAVALLVGRAMSSFLFEVTSRDPATISVTVMALLAATTVAALLPALRAASVDPVKALRGA